jgi:alkylated DNA repair dioxygenase AlkB
MNTLFDIGPVLPEGFNYYPGFITEAEEEQLIQIIKGIELKPMQFHEYTAKRNVKSFGRGWSFTEQELKQGEPIPEAFDFLIEKIATQLSIPFENIAQFLVTEYPAGSLINWHRDAPPFEAIAGISLLTDCTFKLRPHEKEKQTRSNTISLNVQRRSLYTMEEAAKNEWQHSTVAGKRVRYSLTCRTLKNFRK